MEKNYYSYYLEFRDQRGGLFVRFDIPGVFVCSYDYENAMRFSTKMEAETFLKDNKMQRQFKIHFFNN